MTENSIPIDIFERFYFLLFFRERGREGGREGVKHRCVRETWMGNLLHSLTRNWTGDLSIYRLALNLLSPTSQGKSQMTLKRTALLRKFESQVIGLVPRTAWCRLKYLQCPISPFSSFGSTCSVVAILSSTLLPVVAFTSFFAQVQRRKCGRDPSWRLPQKSWPITVAAWGADWSMEGRTGAVPDTNEWGLRSICAVIHLPWHIWMQEPRPNRTPLPSLPQVYSPVSGLSSLFILFLSPLLCAQWGPSFHFQGNSFRFFTSEDSSNT